MSFLALFSHILSLCLILPSLAQDPTPSPSPRRLIFVAELCRHGDRTPLFSYPLDTIPLSKWQEGIGKLTAIGQRAHYDLGSRLRRHYVDELGFLPAAYNAKDIYVRSTDIDRTLMSATSQMAGLYPPGSAANYDIRVRYGKDPLHENEGGLPHLYQPVPVHTTSGKTDMMLLPGANCPRHAKIIKQKLASQEFQDLAEKERPFLDALAKIVGVEPSSFLLQHSNRVSDTWTVYQYHSVPLPTAATPDIVNKARNLSNWYLDFVNRGKESHRLRAGLILDEIRNRIASVILQRSGKLAPQYQQYAKKFVLLSAHDTTVAATLAAMRVFDGVYPPYNSTIIWETYVNDDSSQYFVKVEYNGVPLLLPGCSSTMCPLQEYVSSTFDRTVAGEGIRYVECLVGWARAAAMVNGWFYKRKPDPFNISQPDRSSDRGSNNLLLPIISGVAIIMAILAVVALIKIRNRYKGYSTPEEQALQDMYGRDEITGNARPILM